ncbi:MAG: tetratricopeptide repeat protein, partial [Vicinamibacterales bacterium]
LGWPGIRPSRGVVALGLGAALAVALIPVAVAQSRRQAPPPSAQQVATRLYNEGKYDEVVATLEKLQARDQAGTALLARALSARGKYQEAEAVLRPAASSDPVGDAALELALLLEKFGRPEAEPMLRRLAGTAVRADSPQELARAARALRAVGEAQQASDVYRDAAGLGQRDPYINTAWGEVALEKYQNGDALKSFRLALMVDPTYVPALIGAARALADDNPPEALASAQAALKINPNSVDAHVFIAERAIESGKRDDAKKSLELALAVNASSLEARSLVAGLAFVEDRTADFEAEVARVLALAPKYGDVYRVAGELAASNYRFDEAAALARRAVALEPDNARALADLGVHLLRTGDETGARTALERAFKIDPYHVVTYNLLQMMDTLDDFVTMKEGDLVLKMHKDEAPLLGDYALSLSKQAMATLSKRYGNFQIQGPILVEVFPKHDDFAVRNVGLPGMIGALGACFGRVVTMDSPRARPPGEFQWEATLWHELAHVVTLQMSKQRVPRWLTEGISVYEETLARPEWGRGQDVEFVQMLNQGAILKLKDLNSGFMDPRMISMAYFQASLLVEHLVASFGDAGLHRLLRAYGEGLDSDAALKSALNTDFDQLQVTFDYFIQKRYGDVRKALMPVEKGVDLQRMPLTGLREFVAKNPDSFAGHMMLGTALRRSGAQDEAIPIFEKAAALVPFAIGPTSPHAQIAQIAAVGKDSARAITALREVMRYDFDNIDAPRQLVDLLKDGGVNDAEQLEPVYRRIVAIDPFDQDAHVALGRFAMERKDFEAAMREFRAVVALNPVDRASAHTDLAEAYLRGGKRPEARKQVLAALEIAPSYERAQDLLLELAEARR